MSNRDLIAELLHLDSFNSAVTEKAAAALQAHEWQDISTAPKDGFHILLYRPEIQFVGYWGDAGWCMQGCKLIDPEPTPWQPPPPQLPEGEQMKMKPCPFCGQHPDPDNEYTFQSDQGDKWGYVVCCCQGPEVRTGYKDMEYWRDDAIMEWNKRTPPKGDKDESLEA